MDSGPDSAALQDGSFESAAIPDQAPRMFSPGERVGPWTVTGGKVYLWKGSPGASADSRQHLALSGGAFDRPGSIQQTIATTPGVWYWLTFHITVLANGDAERVRTLAVEAQGRDEYGQAHHIDHGYQSYSVDGTGVTSTEPGWRQRRFVFKAASSQTSLKFTEIPTDSDGVGVCLDDVCLTRAPGTVS
ncbi:DUF642 domain-containing protein [Streptomyces sp. Ac-502]|uniref:DUF642 domain-containing protein n=1 Tax=Streptomyces sp. Ac-502 TaxID=3342801 RepID=UPI0038623BA9